MSIESSRALREPLELGRQLGESAADMDWPGSLQQDDGLQHEEALRTVSGPVSIFQEWLNIHLTKYSRHAEEVSKNPRVDVEAVRNTTYLHEFDR